MFIKVKGNIFNTFQIVSVIPSRERYTTNMPMSGSLFDREVEHELFRIHINTVNFKNDADSSDRYEHTIYCIDEKDWDDTYSGICSALGVAGEVNNVRYNTI
jgi:hypothetical protein